MKSLLFTLLAAVLLTSCTPDPCEPNPMKVTVDWSAIPAAQGIVSFEDANTGCKVTLTAQGGAVQDVYLDPLGDYTICFTINGDCNVRLPQITGQLYYTTGQCFDREVLQSLYQFTGFCN